MVYVRDFYDYFGNGSPLLVSFFFHACLVCVYVWIQGETIASIMRLYASRMI